MVSVAMRRRTVWVSLLGLGIVFGACGQEPREETVASAPSAAPAAPTAAAVDAAQPTAVATVAPAAPPAPAAEAKAVEYETEELPEADLMPETLAEQRAAMFRRMKAILLLDDAQIAALTAQLNCGDLDGDGEVAGPDLGLMLLNYGPCAQ